MVLGSVLGSENVIIWLVLAVFGVMQRFSLFLFVEFQIGLVLTSKENTYVL